MVTKCPVGCGLFCRMYRVNGLHTQTCPVGCGLLNVKGKRLADTKCPVGCGGLLCRIYRVK